ncbi:MAG: HAMP domain-containing histidine kinase [Acidimicrobiaceae bacterium]|nr:HAMP domain-containing histidine kinase [Acidimicrobiaceae bacterium]
MQRRLTIAVVGTVAVALLLASTVTLALVRRADRNAIQQVLEQEADVLASLMGTVHFDEDGDSAHLNSHLVRAAENLNRMDVAVLLLEDGAFVGRLPESVLPSDLQPLASGAEEPISGIRGSTAWAAAIEQTGPVTIAVVLTDPADQFLGAVLRWFGVSAAISLALGAAVAVILSRRLARPLRQARDATRLIAGGDLSARVPTGEGRPDEITDLSASINEMAESLERSQSLERRFLMSISHDLRTPLTSIRGYGEAIADGTAGNREHAAEVIVAEAIRLERLVGDLLDLARLDAREFTLEYHLTDVVAVGREVCTGFARSAADRNVELRVVNDGPVTAWCDPVRVAQVVANLVQNAVRFADSEVQVGYRAHGRGEDARAVITVDDDGPGISEEDWPHVFERLYVARRKPQPKESGSGLGLTIVAQLTETMGGKVSVTARQPTGTRFTVELPAREP